MIATTPAPTTASASWWADRQTRVWVVLLLATVMTAVLGWEDDGGQAAVALAILTIALVKVRLVAMHFMEARDAPAGLRWALEAYSAGVLVSLVALYLAF